MSRSAGSSYEYDLAGTLARVDHVVAPPAASSGDLAQVRDDRDVRLVEVDAHHWSWMCLACPRQGGKRARGYWRTEDLAAGDWLRHTATIPHVAHAIARKAVTR